MKKKILLLIFFICLLTLFLCSCSGRIIPSKYTADTLVLKDGKEYRGVFLNNPYEMSNQYIEIVLSDGSIKKIDRSKIVTFGLTDYVLLNDNSKLMGSIEIKEDDLTLNDVSEFNISDIKRIQFDNKSTGDGVNIRVIVNNKETTGKFNAETINIIKKDYNLQKLVVMEINEIIFSGTNIPEELSIGEQFDAIKEGMGFQNIVREYSNGKVDNGWFYTFLGILVVFAALTLMVICFDLLKHFTKENGNKKKKKDTDKNQQTDISSDGVGNDIISAITLTLFLDEDNEQLVLTINRNKSKSSNWLQSGIIENAERQDFV